MKSKIGIALLLFEFLAAQLLGARAHAAVDFAAEGALRSYPLSGYLGSQVGYGQLLWGSAPGSNTSDINPWYGYARAFLEYDVSGLAASGQAATYNAGIAGVEFFPVSILGVRAGGEINSNGAKYKDFDCELYICTGQFSRTFVEAQVTLGAGPFFVHARGKLEDWRQGRVGGGDFIEPNSALVAHGSGDRVKTGLGIAGARWGQNIKLFYLVIYSQMETVSGDSHLHLGNVSWQSGPWQVTVGGGTFLSALKPLENTVVFDLIWTPWPSLALF